MILYSDVLVSLQKSLPQATNEPNDGILQVNPEVSLVTFPTTQMRVPFSGTVVSTSFVTSSGINAIANEVILAPGLWEFEWSGSVLDNIGGASQARVVLLSPNAIDVLWSYVYRISQSVYGFNGRVKSASYQDGAILRVFTLGTPVLSQFCSVNGTRIL